MYIQSTQHTILYFKNKNTAVLYVQETCQTASKLAYQKSYVAATL